jgi:hypothetical protein
MTSQIRQRRPPTTIVNRPPPLNLVQKQQVRAMTKVEEQLKYFLQQASNNAMTTTPVLFQLSQVPQGVPDSSRIGDRLYWRDIECRGWMEVGDPTNLVRFIIFQWKPNTTPVVGNILLPGFSGSQDVSSTYSHDNRQLFTILYDSFQSLVGNGTATTYPGTDTTQKTFYFKKSIPWKKVQYTGGSTTVGTNQIWYIRIADSGVVPNPFLNFTTKLTFVST